jgi:hypothetical protein
VRDLFPRETIPLPAPPPLLVVSGTKCDLNGNIYLVSSSAPQAVLGQRDGITFLPIQKLSIGSRTVVQYAIPTIPDYMYLRRIEFDVDGRGNVYALFDASIKEDQDKPRSDYLIVKYKDDGTMDSFAKIRGFPDRDFLFPIQPIRLAAFPDGNFLVSGTTLGPRGLGAFTAVFDRGGTFVTDVKVPHDVEPVPFKEVPDSSAQTSGQEAASAEPSGGSQKGEGEGHSQSARRRRSTADPTTVLSGGFAITAPDGNLYMLRATDPLRLYVVSPGGVVEREFEITSPAPGLDPIHMAMAGNSNLFIQFGPVAKGRPDEDLNATRLIAVFDLSTGRATAIYRLAPTESGFNVPACAASPYEFLFVGTSESNELKVVRYSP